jgi:hypothetical protein
MQFQWFLSLLSWILIVKIGQAGDNEDVSCLSSSNTEVHHSGTTSESAIEYSTNQSSPIPTPLSREKNDDIPNGYHTLVFDDDRKYEGNLMNGKFHGQGTYTTREGVYEGFINLPSLN